MDESYPTSDIVDLEPYKRVNKLLHTFDLHACDLPQYYAPKERIPRLRQRADYTPLPDIYHLIDKDKRPIVKIAGDFTDWRLVLVNDIIKVDKYYYGDPYYDTPAYLWPAHRYKVVLPAGRYKYKWYVSTDTEGEWVYSRKAPLMFDNDGNLNNYVDTSSIAFHEECIDQDIKRKEWYLISKHCSLLK